MTEEQRDTTYSLVCPHVPADPLGRQSHTITVPQPEIPPSHLQGSLRQVREQTKKKVKSLPICGALIRGGQEGTSTPWEGRPLLDRTAVAPHSPPARPSEPTPGSPAPLSYLLPDIQTSRLSTTPWVNPPPGCITLSCLQNV